MATFIEGVGGESNFSSQEDSHSPFHPRFCAFCSSQGHLLKAFPWCMFPLNQKQKEEDYLVTGRSLPLPLGVGTAGVQKCNLLSL